jgi:type I restriction enzyme R subunit
MKLGEKVSILPQKVKFSHAWEQRKLGEIGKTYTGLSGKTKEDFGHGEAQLITYMNIFTNPISNPQTTEKVEIDNRQNTVNYGDIFFTTSSETPEEVGMSSIWLDNAENTYLNSFCFGYRLNENIQINPYYLAYLLRAKRFRDNMILLAQGISRYNISKNKVMEISIDIPKNKDEQLRVGSIFKNLDNLIALHQRKRKVAKNTIKSLKIRLFCLKGEKMTFNSESEFEKSLINLLFEKGWERDVLKYKTEEDLIQNWANILFENNRDIDKLNDFPLTRSEMQQIMEQIKRLRTPLKLNGFINGKEVSIKRDNPDDKVHFGKEVRLKIYDRQEIAAGQSRYQIAEQPVFKAKSALLNDRRGDFMLLINGMPVIHVELKKSNVSITQATNQIEKYSHEGVFSGIFSLVQVFVAMTPSETVYFANPGPDGKFNKDFYFHWADFYNEPINDWKSIAEQLISIPMAHQLIGFYTVADNTDGILKVMRSYQYYAASKISDKVSKTKWGERNIYGGYVWHTTGSGKTMTSFKSAQLIANSKDADKVVFLVDRIELGTQSLLEYRGFASENESVQATENTGVLITRLKSDDADDTLIVTSIQKMSRIKEEGAINDHDIKKINSKRVVFIIDECHRDTFGEMLSTIKSTFPLAIFFGFTGTPIHEENKKKMNTTSTIFGDELHRYSIADGIRDGNVLGFDPYMVTTYKERDIRKKIALEMAKASTEEEAISDPAKRKVYYYFMKLPMENRIVNDKLEHGLEDYIPKSQYQTEVHQNAVVDDIVEGFTTLSVNGKFHAIFATSSIPEAIDYYKLFKKKNTNLKVAALFDQNIDNSDGAILKEDAVIEMLNDYNKMYKQSFSIPTYQKYKKDIQLRLSHKEYYRSIENTPEKQLDVLIVVDQMLTGFDSKWVNTLYLDKLMRYESIIQAFSRTNRLFDKAIKPFGVIKYYRKPYTMKQNIEEAVKLYSGDKPLGLFVDKLPENLKAMNDIYDEIVEVFVSSGVENFCKLPDEDESKAKFADLFKRLNKHLEAAKIQGFRWNKLEYENIELKFDETTYLVLALRYKELTKTNSGTPIPDIPYDIEGYLTEISTEDIDTNYMNSKFKKYLKEINLSNAEEALNELHKTFAMLSQEEQKYAYQFIMDIQSGSITVDETKSFRDYITEYQINAKNDQIHRFAEVFGLNEALLRKFMKSNVTPEDINAYGKFDELENSADKLKTKKYFESMDGVSIPPFKAIIKLDSYLRKFILEGGFDINMPDNE